jgi:uncharacterized protein YcnI
MIAVKPMPKRAEDRYRHRQVPRPTTSFTAPSVRGRDRGELHRRQFPDAYYDEFVITGFLAGDLEAGKLLYFPVVQECEKGVHRWIEIPPQGNHPAIIRSPRLALKLLPKM